MLVASAHVNRGSSKQPTANKVNKHSWAIAQHGHAQLVHLRIKQNAAFLCSNISPPTRHTHTHRHTHRPIPATTDNQSSMDSSTHLSINFCAADTQTLPLTHTQLTHTQHTHNTHTNSLTHTNSTQHKNLTHKTHPAHTTHTRGCHKTQATQKSLYELSAFLPAAGSAYFAKSYSPGEYAALWRGEGCSHKMGIFRIYLSPMLVVPARLMGRRGNCGAKGAAGVWENIYIVLTPR
jgi:hypothetical protein